MNTMKKLTALLLAVAATSLAGRAQTTNFIVNEFNTAADLCAGAQIGSWAAPTVHR